MIKYLRYIFEPFINSKITLYSLVELLGGQHPLDDLAHRHHRLGGRMEAVLAVQDIEAELSADARHTGARPTPENRVVRRPRMAGPALQVLYRTVAGCATDRRTYEHDEREHINRCTALTTPRSICRDRGVMMALVKAPSHRISVAEQQQ